MIDIYTYCNLTPASTGDYDLEVLVLPDSFESVVDEEGNVIEEVAALYEWQCHSEDLFPLLAGLFVRENLTPCSCNVFWGSLTPPEEF